MMPVRQRTLTTFVMILALLAPCGAIAREPIGWNALNNVAPLGGTLDQARTGLAGLKVEEIELGDGSVLLLAPGISVAACNGRVYSVTRQLGRTPGDGIVAVMRISTFAGSPLTNEANVVGAGGGSSLSFSWSSLPNYNVTIIEAEGNWSAHEALFEEDTC